MTSKDNEITVYWCPNFSVDPEMPVDWTMIYRVPESKGESGNTFTLSTNVGVDFFYDPKIFEFKSNIETYIGGRNEGDLEGNNLVLSINAGWIFFSEEDLSLKVINPDEADAPHVKQGLLKEATHNVSCWFKPIDAKFSLPSGEKRFAFQRQEPIAEIEFLTEKKVNLQRFVPTESLMFMRNSCLRTSILFDDTFSQEDLEKIFVESEMHKIVLREIKNNLL